MTDKERLTADLIRDEDLRLKPYRDTAGKLTIGIGQNLDDVGITEAEARFLLANDIAKAIEDAKAVCPSFETLPEPAQRALANMAFNLGRTRLSKFKNMLAALEAKDFETAAREALDSKWAEQVGERAWRIAQAIKGN